MFAAHWELASSNMMQACKATIVNKSAKVHPDLLDMDINK